VKKYQMWIDGKWVDAISGETYSVVNPATEEEIAKVPKAGQKDVDKAVEAARKAFPIWSKKSQAERSRILNHIADLIRKHTQELVEIDILDHGTPVGISRGTANGLPHDFEYAAEVCKTLMRAGESRIDANTISYFQREPVGVCACITPWNFPLTVTGKIGPSIAAGNTCVLKPPSVDSLPALTIAKILAEESELPPGVVNVITGPGDTVGEALTSHPGVGMISFMGSSEAGKVIMASASKTVKRITMELGGKNPFIVLKDADLDAAVGCAAFASFFNTGMVCASPGRYYIHESLYDEFVSKLIAAAKKIVVGDPNDKNTSMGPVVSAQHRDKVEGLIKSGIQEGAKLLLGGKRPTTKPLDKGYYILPTVLGDVTQNMRVAREEIFGPVACVMKFSSEDEVMKLANDNLYGLVGSVWTKNLAKGRRFADAIQCGTFWINTHMEAYGGTPAGGFKESGFGKDAELKGQEEYTQLKVITINTAEKN
jgi:acyl-CoA reductase-like NAD-dependent aldehyde dehydrogenase